jgi:hypothetical protein
VMCSGFGGVGLFESVMLPDRGEVLRCRGPLHSSIAIVLIALISSAMPVAKLTDGPEVTAETI